MITQRIKTHLTGALRATLSVGNHLGDGPSEAPAEKSLPNVRRETSQNLVRGKVQQKTKRVPLDVHLLSLLCRHVRLRGFRLRGRKELCKYRGRSVRGARRKTLRALQLQRLNQSLHTDGRHSLRVLGPTIHDVSSKGAL